MSRGKRFARRRERYETAEAALGPEAPGAKAFAVSGDLVRAFIAPADRNRACTPDTPQSPPA